MTVQADDQAGRGDRSAGPDSASADHGGRNRHSGRDTRARATAAAVMALARWTPWLEQEMCGLPGLVGPGSVCVDVGAAAGLYTLALSQLAGPAGQIHSVEPVPFAHPVWSRLLAARTAANVRHHALALGAEPGDGKMSVPIGRYGPVTGRSFLTRGSNGLGSNAEFADHRTVEVAVDTLDGLRAAADLTRLDFIKIDVEGAELRVLRGGQRALADFGPALLIEIEARHTARYQYAPDEIVGWLTERGYIMYAWRAGRKHSQGWQRISRVGPAGRNYLFCQGGHYPGAR